MKDALARRTARAAAGSLYTSRSLANMLANRPIEASVITAATEAPTITLASTSTAMTADWPAVSGGAALATRFKFRCLAPTPHASFPTYIQSRGPLSALLTTRATVQPCIEFTTDAPIFEVVALGVSNSQYVIFVDGKQVGTSVASKPNDAAKYYDRYDYSAATQPRRIRNVQIFANKSFAFYGIRTGADGDLVIPTPRRPRCLVIGDSYTDGGGSPYYNYQNWGETMCRDLGWDFYSSGVGGSGYISTNGGLVRNFAQRYPDDVPTGFDIYVFAMGINDIPNEIYASHAWTQADLNAAQQSAIAAVLADNPSATVIVFGPWRGSSGNAGSYTTPAMDTAMQNVVAGFTSAYRRRLFYVPTINDPLGPWMFGSLSSGRFPIYGVTADGTHLMAPGNEWLGHRGARGTYEALTAPGRW